MIKNKRIYILILIVFMVFVTGCATLQRVFPRRVREEALEVAPLLRFSDIPIPVRFKILYEDSYSFQTDRVRVALLRYTGRQTPESVRQFYKDNMSLYNWTLINIIEHDRIIMLNFEKENESCIITIERARARTNITIALSPKARGSAELSPVKK